MRCHVKHQEPVELKSRAWKWIGHTLRKTVGNIAKATLDWNPQGREGATCSDMEAFSFGRTTGQRCDVGGSQENSAEQKTYVPLGNKKTKNHVKLVHTILKCTLFCLCSSKCDVQDTNEPCQGHRPDMSLFMGQ